MLSARWMSKFCLKVCFIVFGVQSSTLRLLFILTLSSWKAVLIFFLLFLLLWYLIPLSAEIINVTLLTVGATLSDHLVTVVGAWASSELDGTQIRWISSTRATLSARNPLRSCSSFYLFIFFTCTGLNSWNLATSKESSFSLCRKEDDNLTHQRGISCVMFRSLSKRLTTVAVPSIITAASFFYRQKVEASSSQAAITESNLVVLSGSANLVLSQQIAELLKTPLLDVTTKRFSDGEINCVINESIRGKDVFIIQTCAAPVNDNVMELLLTVAAARRAGANTVTTVIPYFGYKYHRRYR